MTTHKLFALSLVVVLTAAGAAQAAVGTPKANGQFGGWGWVSRGSASRSVYRSPVVHRSPMVYAAPAAPTAVAQAPTEGRRFSVAPSTQPAQGAVVQPSTGRRYSYQPQHYSAGRRGGGQVERWALPKTDARKFSGR